MQFEFLSVREILIHPFALGEIACGNLQSRPKVLANLNALPAAIRAYLRMCSLDRDGHPALADRVSNRQNHRLDARP
jgi:hypothetical protein